MLQINKDRFDSEIFKKEVYRLSPTDLERNASELDIYLKQLNFDVVYCFSDFNPQKFSLLSSIGFELVSVRAQYAIDIQKETKKSENKVSNARLVRLSAGSLEIPEEDISKFAYLIAFNSRYFKDNRIAKENSHILYKTWLTNSIRHQYANEVIVALVENEVAAIVTIKIKEQCGYIDLIGTAENHQKKGIGSLLIDETAKYLKENNVFQIKVTTECENIPSNRLYQMNGFLMEEVSFAYHLHKDRFVK